MWDWLTVRLYALIHVQRYRDKVFTVAILFGSFMFMIAEIYKLENGIKVSPFELLCAATSAAVFATTVIWLINIKK